MSKEMEIELMQIRDGFNWLLEEELGYSPDDFGAEGYEKWKTIQALFDKLLSAEANQQPHRMPDGRPIFGEDSPHDIREHLENVCSEQPVGCAQALSHLGDVLCMLAELHPDDQCRAYVEALAYYNAQCPNEQVVPEEGYSSRIVTTGPLDRLPERESSPPSDTEIANVIGNAWNAAIKHDKSPRQEAAIALLEHFELRRRS